MQTVLIHKCMCVRVTNQLYGGGGGGGGGGTQMFKVYHVLLNLHFEIVDEILFCSVIPPDTQ